MLRLLQAVTTVAAFSLFAQSLQAADICAATATEPPPQFTAIKAKVDARIRTFANSKAIATLADKTLSQLISGKSKLIADWMAKRHLSESSEDEIVRHWRDYYARNFILTKYPHGEAAINKAIESLMTNVNGLVANKNFQRKMQKFFEESQKAALRQIESWDLNEEAKKQLVDRVGAIRLYWMKDFKDSKFKQLPLDFLDWGIAYDPATNEINMGLNALAYPNDATYLAVLAHEIGHSFDSCRWGAYFKGPWPFTDVGACLRSAGSVAAKSRDDTKLDLLAKAGPAGAELALSLKQNPTCNKLTYPPAGMQADQLPESFADWFSAEVMATMKSSALANLRSDLCGQTKLRAGSSYPSNEARLRRIYLAQPTLRAAFTRASEAAAEPTKMPPHYCSFTTQK